MANNTNFSIEFGSFPTDLKVDVITSIGKSENRLCVDDYTPITVQAVICKIIEKCIYKQIVCFLKKHNLITDH